MPIVIKRRHNMLEVGLTFCLPETSIRNFLSGHCLLGFGYLSVRYLQTIRNKRHRGDEGHMGQNPQRKSSQEGRHEADEPVHLLLELSSRGPVWGRGQEAPRCPGEIRPFSHPKHLPLSCGVGRIDGSRVGSREFYLFIPVRRKGHGRKDVPAIYSWWVL